MLNLLNTEFYKLFHSRYFWGIVACPLQSVPSWPRTGPLRTNLSNAISTARRARAPLAVFYTLCVPGGCTAPHARYNKQNRIGGTVCRNFGRAVQARP